ncbi:peptidylprolyl isomerase [Chitinilyticum piscinae]|uniref:Chaperone SurA n=1 Tax=Chitinilyticum piscinae TaxID=2866724 RepID=A0A8J7FMA2_9NEIS|nr:peptidylprolyl isomerase [Chitinilyticum piscinae]MBE9610572.1 peptidylprolyl isomerase [Chitinilyticum piscinae]
MKPFTPLLLAAVLCSPFSQAAIATVDRVVAVVNRNAITQQELDQRIDEIRASLKQKNAELPPAAMLQERVLENLILEQVQLQRAQTIGLRIDDAFLENGLNRLAAQNNASLAEFRSRVEASGLDWKQFRESVRQQMLLGRLREKEVDSQVQVSDAELDDYLKLAADKAPVEFNLSQIYVPVPDNASPEQIQAARVKINDARKDLLAGRDFATVAATYSASGEMAKAGNLGWRSSASLPAPFVNLLNQTESGGITDVVRTPGGFHVFKLNEKRTQSEKVVVKQTHVRHILIRPNELVSENDALRKLTQLRTRIQQGEKFTELAKIYSEDGSASKGGDLGWISPGETVPQFEEAMNALAIGELSKPVRSPFGLHLILVEERRDQDITKDRERAKLRMEIRQRKAEEQYEDWLRQLRDRAYVVYKLKDE